jgi:hypothetical protein
MSLSELLQTPQAWHLELRQSRQFPLQVERLLRTIQQQAVRVDRVLVVI